MQGFLFSHPLPPDEPVVLPANTTNPPGSLGKGETGTWKKPPLDIRMAAVVSVGTDAAIT